VLSVEEAALVREKLYPEGRIRVDLAGRDDGLDQRPGRTGHRRSGPYYVEDFRGAGFAVENPNEVPEGQDFTANLNPHSLEVLNGAKLEPSLRGAAVGSRYQFERLGYFCVDKDSTAEKLVFNRTVALRDAWAKIEKAQQQKR